MKMKFVTIKLTREQASDLVEAIEYLDGGFRMENLWPIHAKVKEAESDDVERADEIRTP